ncbi:MAG: flagellar hook-length control protein FliK [Eubacteriales bacterium]|nr:flagellar hook-length control protein FliK [Eubacteriales bacterium]
MVSAAAVLGTAKAGNYSAENKASATKPSVKFDNVMSAALTADTKKNTNQAQKTSENDIKKTPDEKQKIQTDDGKSDTELEDIDSKLENIAEDLKEKIKETFGVTDEQLEDAMAVLGIELLNLLQPDNLTQLAAVVNGQSDTLSILLNEDLSSGLQNLLEFLNEQMTELADSRNISVEQLQNIIDITVEDVDAKLQADQQVQPGENRPETVENASEKETFDAEKKSGTLTEVIEGKLTSVSQDFTAGRNDTFLKGHQHSLTKTDAAEHQISSGLAQEISNSFAEILATGNETVNAADIVRQVVDSVKLTQVQQLQSIEVALNPENLGKVTVNVTARNGIVTAQLVAENEQVKQALESQMISLKEKFDNQGIRVDAVEVTVLSHSFEAGENLKGNDSREEKEGKKSFGHLKLDSLDDLEESDLTDEEIRARDSIKNGISSVEYSA